MTDDDALYRTRQGFWLRMARESSGIKQQGAADKVGLRTKAAISDYENGVTQVPIPRLRRLASLYGWPLVLFTEPAPTAFEQAEERMAQLARAAIRLAHEDLDAGGPPAPDGDAPPGAPPGRRSA